MNRQLSPAIQFFGGGIWFWFFGGFAIFIAATVLNLYVFSGKYEET